ncbi:MAG TPA: tartrate dehydrogenase [Terriglobia bacterium]|nr:tartrate dehydrogenase [Terriglobia bacterium]
MTLSKPRKYSIAVIPGDGIGREVVPAAVEVLQRLGERFGLGFGFRHYDWGSDYYFEHGTMMPADGLDQLCSSDAILLGAIGHPKIQDNITLNGLLLPIRRAFDQFVNVRPAILFPGVKSPLASVQPGGIDMVVVRENTEGEYAQVGGFVHHFDPKEVAVQTSVFTRQGVERVIRFAFELAVKRDGKKRVASITKSNAQAFGMVLWDRVFEEMKNEFPQIETESLLVDAATIHFLKRPESFDVVVASNLFGDILSDLSAAITGSIGLAPSANLDPLRRFPSMFEPVHGSAPDIAGQGKANPLATFFSAAMMLEHLGAEEAAGALDGAVRSLLREGKVRTPDLGGSNSTQEVTAAIIEAVVHG